MARESIFKRWWFWVIALVLLGVIVYAITVDQDGEPKPTPTDEHEDGGNVVPTDTASPNNQDEEDIQNDNEGQTKQPITTADPDEEEDTDEIEAGMYKVGQDIEANEYLMFADEGAFSYYQVSKDSSGELESIISNDNFRGTRYITVSNGQYIELRDAVMYRVEIAPTLSSDDNKYYEGMYKVGRDIAAGEYKVIPDDTENAYFEVSKDSKGLIESIVTNDNFSDEKYITISDGQYIKLVSCYLTR